MKNQKGFTLVELMVVMAIIAILATAGITQYTGFIKGARDTTRSLDLKAIETIVISEMGATGVAPTKDKINELLKEKAGKTFKDPSNGSTTCWAWEDEPGTCQYQYASCDNGGGYVIRFQFEDMSKVAKYEEDEYSGADGSTEHFDTGNCINDYPADTDFEIIQGSTSAA